jgi:hypothetical protein
MTTPPELYIPPGCFTMKDSPVDQQIRLGIQGYGNTGKTYAGLTFPNVVALDLDRGMGAHVGRTDVIQVPIYDLGYCKTIIPSATPADTKDVLMMWLEKHARKMSPNQTLLMDGNTGIQNAYHRWFENNKSLFLTKGGEVDGFAEWKVKRQYYSEIMELLKTLRCHVVFICHEIDQKDKNGVAGPTYSGKVRPLLTGAFGDELSTHFTDWFRQHCNDKPTLESMDEARLKLWGLSKVEFKAMMDSFEGNSIYYWQTEGDAIFDAKRSSLVKAPRFIPARYESFLKYRRK